MRFALGMKQIAAIVASFVAIYFISAHHEALQRWFQKTSPGVQQPRGEGWQDGGGDSGSGDGGSGDGGSRASSGGQPFGQGVPSQFVGWVFAAIAAGIFILYFAIREYVAPIEYKGGWLNPPYRKGEFSPLSSSAGRTPPRPRSQRDAAGKSRSVRRARSATI